MEREREKPRSLGALPPSHRVRVRSEASVEAETRVGVMMQPVFAPGPRGQDSSKGGAVETGCSGLYDVIYYVITNEIGTPDPN